MKLVTLIRNNDNGTYMASLPNDIESFEGLEYTSDRAKALRFSYKDAWRIVDELCHEIDIMPVLVNDVLVKRDGTVEIEKFHY